jgi:hypothetical protein
MPIHNETDSSHAAEEARNALCTELQQLGRFEVIPAPPEVCVEFSQMIRENGRFNELVMIQLARQFRADAIIMGTLSQFSPYNPVRMGLVLQVVSPGDGMVVASVDGMWDSANPWIAQRARNYYEAYCRGRDKPLTANLVLDSPRLYQRFVCSEAAHILVDERHEPLGLVPAVPPPGATEGNATPSADPGCAPGQAMPLPAGPAPNPGLLPQPLKDGGP